MAITIDTTIGGASSNSYATEEEFAAFAGTDLDGAAVYAAADDEDRKRALVMAARRLDQERWRGARVTTTQKLAHPRSFLPKVDGANLIGSYSGAALRDYYLTTEIAPPVKDACCALALAYLGGFREEETNSVESFASDGVSIRFRQTGGGGRELPLPVAQLIGGLILQDRWERA